MRKLSAEYMKNYLRGQKEGKRDQGRYIMFLFTVGSKEFKFLLPSPFCFRNPKPPTGFPMVGFRLPILDSVQFRVQS